MKKTFGVPAVHFKGSGWARKERSSGGKPNRAGQKEAGATRARGQGRLQATPARRQAARLTVERLRLTVERLRLTVPGRGGRERRGLTDVEATVRLDLPFGGG